MDTHIYKIAGALFGEDAVASGRGRRLHEAIKGFTNEVTVNAWHCWRGNIKRHRTAISKLELQLDEQWEGASALHSVLSHATPYSHIFTEFTRNRGKCTKVGMRSWLSKLETLIDYQRTLKDPVNVAHLQDRLATLYGFMEVMGMDKSGKTVKGTFVCHESAPDALLTSMPAAALPATLVEAIRQLASENDLQEIRTKVYERITEIQNDSDVIDLPNGEFVNMEWSEGTEDFQSTTREDIAVALGLVNGEIPNFNAFLDPRGEKTYWDDPGWFADPAHAKLPCSPRWHQLVGLLAMIHRAFDGKNVLLMDEVGLGKTMQIVGVIAILAFFREYYDAKGHFPGAFSESRIFHD